MMNGDIFDSVSAAHDMLKQRYDFDGIFRARLKNAQDIVELNIGSLLIVKSKNRAKGDFIVEVFHPPPPRKISRWRHLKIALGFS